jgi:glycosyltransferase involved in cell wall biosynthesis
MRLSLVVITLDEERNIAGCLDSVPFADEKLVVDSGSSDDTVEAAARCGARVLKHSFESFGSQKQWAVDRAGGDVILVLDADEKLDADLARRMEEMLSSEGMPLPAYRLRRHSFYMGRLLRLGPWMRDRPIRLFLKGRAVFNASAVHEQLVVDGRVGLLREGWIEHVPYDSVADHMHKMADYGRLWARQQASLGRKARLDHLVLRPAWRLFLSYFLRLGFLEGYPGLVASVIDSFYAFAKWSSLLELNRLDGEEK